MNAPIELYPSIPLARDNFYPDFVAELVGGRLLVVEYKGAHIVTTDETREKVAVGLKWEEAMRGQGLFMLGEKVVEGQSPREQILAKIGQVRPTRLPLVPPLDHWS